MTKGIAKVCSEALGPFPQAVLLMVIVPYSLTRDWTQALLWVLIGLFCIAVFPYALIFTLYWLGKLSSIDMKIRKERPPVILNVMIVIALGTISCYTFNAPRPFFLLMLSILVAFLIGFIITLFWKVSFHTLCYGGTMTSLALVVGKEWLWMIIFLPVLAWSRVYLKRHTVAQTIVGAIIGIAAPLVVFQLA